MVIGILFDYGDTLVRTEPNALVLSSILDSLGFDFDPQAVVAVASRFGEHWNANYASLPRGRRWTRAVRIDCNKTVLEGLGLDQENFPALASRVTDLWPKYEKRSLYDDVLATLRTLSQASLPMGVVSQNLGTSSYLRKELDQLGISKYFKIVLTSEDVGYDKPDARLFLESAREIGLRPSDIFYVGNDYQKDVVGARAAGMRPVLVDRGRNQCYDDCIVISDLNEASGVVRRGGL